MTIQAVIKYVYGNYLAYPIDEKTERAIRLLTGNKTLTTQAIKGLELLGHTIQISNPYIRN